MDEQMFCFQCEQAAGCTACTGAAGVCGKSAETAAAQDRLTGALIAFAGQLIAAGRGPAPEQARLLMQGLFTTITNVDFDPQTVAQLTDKVWKAKQVFVSKRGQGTGYSGIENPLFYKENNRMLFGDAKKMLDEVLAALKS